MIFMKSTERIVRMKNKSTKAYLYKNLYPINLYISTLDNWEDVTDFFDFFANTKDLRNDDPGEVNKAKQISGATYLVREKNTRAVGILILLDDFNCSTLAHESVHYADAVYDYLKMYSVGYDEGNEQYAYLITWCVDCLVDFIECIKKERKTTRKTTKQGGN